MLANRGAPLHADSDIDNDPINSSLKALKVSTRSAYVTHLCDKAEGACPEGIAARRKEINNLFDEGSFGDPVAYQSLLDRAKSQRLADIKAGRPVPIRHTISSSMMLTSIKNYEFLLRRSYAAIRKHAHEDILSANTTRASIGCKSDNRISGHARQAQRVAALADACVELEEVILEIFDAENGLQHVPSPTDASPVVPVGLGASSCEPKWKGRFVVLGHIVRDLISNRIVFGRRSNGPAPGSSSLGPFECRETDRPPPPDLWHAVASLQAARFVLAHGLGCSWAVESVDLRNAFVQCPWTDTFSVQGGGPQHWLEIAPDVVELFPAAYRAKFQSLVRPLVPLQKCLYGHPLSGLCFCESLFKVLKADGWVESATCAGLLHKGRSTCCVYVDDILCSGPPSERKLLWESLAAKFTFGAPPYPVTKFLGCNVRFFDIADQEETSFGSRSAALSMTEYCKDIGNNWALAFGKPLRHTWSPATVDVRLSAPIKVDDVVYNLPLAKLRSIQSLLGQCLWAARVARPDVIGPVSFLCTRVGNWSDACDVQLQKLCCYLWSTADKALFWHIDGESAREDLFAVAYTDSDWRVPRSQSAYVLCIQNVSGSSRLCVDWSSKRQAMTATSSGTAEVIAAHHGVVSCGPLATLWCEFVSRSSGLPSPSSGSSGFDNAALIVRVDNVCPLRIARRGWSIVSRECSLGGTAPFDKAMGLKSSYLRDLQRNSVIHFGHVRSRFNLSDLPTKVHPRVRHLYLASNLGFGIHQGAGSPGV